MTAEAHDHAPHAGRAHDAGVAQAGLAHDRHVLEAAGAVPAGPPGRHVPPITALSDTVMMLRDGDVAAAFTLDGVDPLVRGTGDIAEAAALLAGVAARLEPDMSLTLHRMGGDASGLLADLAPVPPDRGPAAGLDAQWRAALGAAADAGGLQRRVTVVTLTVKPARAAGLLARFRRGTGSDDAARARQTAMIARLERALGAAMAALGPLRPRRLALSSGDWLGALAGLVEGRMRPLVPPAAFVPLGHVIAARTIAFIGDRLVVTGGPEVRHGAILGIAAWPGDVPAGISALLDLPGDTVVTLSWTPEYRLDALGRLTRQARRMAASGDAAASQRAALCAAADDLQSGRIAFGNVQFSVALRAGTPEALDAAAARATRVLQERLGASVRREGPGLALAFYAQFPGNAHYRARAALLSSANLGDLAPLAGTAAGPDPAHLPWQAPVTVLPTLTGTPYRLAFHAPSRAGALTPGHTLVIGATGSGKTVTMLFLVAQALRADPPPRVLLIDRDRGMQAGLTALGADYAPVRAGEPAGLSPFAEATGERDIPWLAAYVREVLAGDAGVAPLAGVAPPAGVAPLTPEQAQAIADAARANAAAGAHLRTFAQFREQFRGLDDGAGLWLRLARWDTGGEHGWLFEPVTTGTASAAGATGAAGAAGADGATGADGGITPVMRDGAGLTGWDLTEVMDLAAPRTAWMAHAFRRVERLCEDGYPTLVVLDEAWKLLDDAWFAARLKDWLLTMRKKNCAVILMTQRVSHLMDSAAGTTILESAPGRLIFPNRRATEAELAPLGLNAAETALLLGQSAMSRIALHQLDGVSAALDLDLSGLGPWLDALSGRAGAGPAGGAGWPGAGDGP